MSRNFPWKPILISLIVLILAGGLLFNFRNHPLVIKFTNKPAIFFTINQLAKITDLPFYVYKFLPNKLPNYHLFIQEQDLEKLQASLAEAMNNNRKRILGDLKSVPVVFVDDKGEIRKAKGKYRGDTGVHWEFAKKSWRINFNNEDNFNGLKSFDLIIPGDRGLVLEHLANFRAKKLNLLSPQSWFVNLYINQKSPAVYYAAERLDEDFISRRGLTGTLFGKRDEGNWNDSIYSSVDLWRAFPDNNNNPDFIYLKKLISLINNPETTASELLTLIDLDNFLRWQVHGLLMGSFAQDEKHNNCLFFNHAINKFQFIPCDTGSRHSSFEDLDRLYNPIADRLLADPTIKAKRNKLLEEYISNTDNLTEDLAFFENSLKQIRTPLLQDNIKFYANIKYLLDIKTYRLWLLQHFSNLSAQL